MALNGLYCADVPLSNYSLTHSPVSRITIHCTGGSMICKRGVDHGEHMEREPITGIRGQSPQQGSGVPLVGSGAV